VIEALTGLASLVRDGAVTMRDSLGATSLGRARELERLRALGGEAAQARQRIVDLTRDAFVTPYDRGDIHLLAVTLTDCLAHLERVVDGGIRHRIEEAPDGMADQIDLLVRMAELTANAMPRLRSLDEVADYPAEIRRLATQAHRVRTELLTEDLATGSDPLLALRSVVVNGDLAQAVRAFEQMAAGVEGIIVKES